MIRNTRTPLTPAPARPPKNAARGCRPALFLFLFLPLFCLASAGCAGAGRARPAGPEAPPAAPKTLDDYEHDELERDLNLYSD